MKSFINADRRRRFVMPAVFAVLPLLWEGMPFTLMGGAVSSGRYLVSALMLAGTAGYFFLVISGRKRADKWDLWSLALALLIILVSFISNTFLFEQSPSEWLFAMYGLTPILLIFFARSLDVRPVEIIEGIILAAVIACCLIIADQIVQLKFMNPYSRLATTDIHLRRIVILKIEIAAAAMICCARFARSKSTARLRWLAAILPMLFCLFVVSESRVTIAAFILGLGGFTIFVLHGRERVQIMILSVLVFFVSFPFVLKKYVDQFQRYGNYITDDASISWRLKTVRYYYGHFTETGGLGFGVMSTGAARDNFLSFGTNRAGVSQGAYGYNFYMADTGITGALLQFGYLGLVLVIVMSFMCAFALIARGRDRVVHSSYELGVLGFLVLFYLLNPWPMNFFTLEWSVLSGGLFWSLAALSSRENAERIARATSRGHASLQPSGRLATTRAEQRGALH
ncbi:hypothetical protein [Phenylobacterium sp.]|uniref:hypothetical protein n=1 Tax=Phenylobacterium sp. TaxID=1871053 RepID=UPI0027364BE1|nr:hypothetical protein [Phenylobacterium sp.]MDP3632758.1 hypothetical protein [Phenylobacterium sp.]